MTEIVVAHSRFFPCHCLPTRESQSNSQSERESNALILDVRLTLF